MLWDTPNGNFQKQSYGEDRERGWLRTEVVMWRGIGACRSSVGMERTSVIQNMPKSVSHPNFCQITLTPKQYFGGTTSTDWKSSLVEWNEVVKVTNSTYCDISKIITLNSRFYQYTLIWGETLLIWSETLMNPSVTGTRLVYNDKRDRAKRFTRGVGS